MANPMYRQIAEDLRAQIEDGGLQPGEQLRTEIELRERYGASRNTVRDAVKLLTAWGMVETKPGQGTFVVRKIEPYVTNLTANPKDPTLYGEAGDAAAVESVDLTHKRVFNTPPQVEIQKAPAGIARLLQIGEGSQVISRHQKRSIDGTRWSMQTSFYPMGFVLKGAELLIQADDIATGTMKYLEQTLGLRQIGHRDWITLRTADSTEASFFSLPPDGRVDVFEVFRITFDQTGTPMRLTVTQYPTDRNQFVVDVGKVPQDLGSQPGPIYSDTGNASEHYSLAEDMPDWAIEQPARAVGAAVTSSICLRKAALLVGLLYPYCAPFGTSRWNRAPDG
jgi:GntR family transcriptional regulator